MAFRFCYIKLNYIYSYKYSETSNLLYKSNDGKFREYQDIDKENEIIQIEMMMSYIKMMIM